MKLTATDGTRIKCLFCDGEEFSVLRYPPIEDFNNMDETLLGIRCKTCHATGTGTDIDAAIRDMVMNGAIVTAINKVAHAIAQEGASNV